jgi:hypothetical protein
VRAAEPGCADRLGGYRSVAVSFRLPMSPEAIEKNISAAAEPRGVVKPAAGYQPLACSSPEAVQTTGTVAKLPSQIGASGKARRNLYSAFIEQNLNASRILIVEGASGPAHTRPGPEERESPSPDNVRVWLSWFG